MVSKRFNNLRKTIIVISKGFKQAIKMFMSVANNFVNGANTANDYWLCNNGVFDLLN